MTDEERRAAQIERAWLKRADDGTMTAPDDSILVCAYCTQDITAGETFALDTGSDTGHPQCLDRTGAQRLR